MKLVLVSCTSQLLVSGQDLPPNANKVQPEDMTEYITKTLNPYYESLVTDDKLQKSKEELSLVYGSVRRGKESQDVRERV